MLPSGAEAIQHPERGGDWTLYCNFVYNEISSQGEDSNMNKRYSDKNCYGNAAYSLNILGILYGNFGDLRLLLLEEFCRSPIDQFESKPQAESESESDDIESLGEFVVVEDANDESFMLFWRFLMPLGGGIRSSSLLSILCAPVAWTFQKKE
uniref:Uncharacterized protein n=1 Tax=Glossina austeni TaxID=7395 RepID=A0A1A9V330_GLOAU